MSQPTTVRVRDITLPPAVPGNSSPGTMALLTLDNGADHTRPTVLDDTMLISLGEALDDVVRRAAAGEIAAVGVTGKPHFFAAGADLKKIATIHTKEDARAVAQLGHAQLRRLGELGVPSFAFINGVALGGGLEVALHCTYRTICATAVVGLPETMLGLIPGWGGAYLLPRLIGPQAAIQVIVSNPLQQNRTLTGAAAAQLGIADVVLDPADFLVDSLRWTSGVLADPASVRRSTDHTVDPTWQPAVKMARGVLKARVGDAAPAPYRALDLIAAAQMSDADAGYAAEDEALAELVMSEEFRSGLYAFDLVQRRAKKPPAGFVAELARPVTKVGIVGAGLMASQLALLFARQLDVPVVMSDLDAARVEKGVAYVRAEIAKQAESGRLGPDRANRLCSRIAGTVGTAAFADAEFVIEAVFEDLEIKRQVFASLESVVGPECILATNTSSLSVTAMADGLNHPERVVGFHFFNPVAVMPLLEVVHGEKTDEATIAAACAVAKGLRKTIIRVADSPSFVVNRLLGRMMSEIGAIVDAGTPIEVAERSLAGMAPMPPFELIDLVGPAVAMHNTESLRAAFPDRFVVPECLRAVVAAGKRAFYLSRDRSDPNARPKLDPEVQALLPQPESPAVLTNQDIRDRVLDALADEAGRMLADGVVAEPQDLDLAMITGAGFPFWNGGLLPLLDREGASERIAGRRFLPRGVASMPR